MHMSRASMSQVLHTIGIIAKKGEVQKLERAIEEEPLSWPKLTKQALQERRWESSWQRSPIAPQHDPGLQHSVILFGFPCQVS
jgi:hypothetical protein